MTLEIDFLNVTRNNRNPVIVTPAKQFEFGKKAGLSIEKLAPRARFKAGRTLKYTNEKDATFTMYIFATHNTQYTLTAIIET